MINRTRKRRFLGFLIAAVACLGAAAPAHAAQDPPLTVAQSQLDSALQCDELTPRDRPPVLFVHGAFATGPEEWDWTTRPELRARGFATCVVTLPDRVIGSDLQVAAEYVVNAVHHIYEGADRRKVAVIGHSAGAPVARWALRWWRGVRKRVADLVSLAGINHGAMFDPDPLSGTALMTPAMWQLSVGSRFLQALNEDEAPRPVNYTAIYSRYDVFQLPPHEGRAAIALGDGRANVSNILIQDVCPGMLTEHFTLIADASVHSLIVDALLHDGPASVDRSGAREACTLSPLNPSALTALDRLARGFPGILQDSIANGSPELPLVNEEPPLKPYVGSGFGVSAACARAWRALFTAVRYYRLANQAMSRAVRSYRFGVRVYRATSSARIKSLVRSYARRLVRRYFRAQSLRRGAMSYYFAQRRSIRARC